MTVLAEAVRQLALVVVGWTLVSLVATWPIVWWMRRRSALNADGLDWLADQPLDQPAALSATGARPLAGGLPRP